MEFVTLEEDLIALKGCPLFPTKLVGDRSEKAAPIIHNKKRLSDREQLELNLAGRSPASLSIGMSFLIETQKVR